MTDKNIPDESKCPTCGGTGVIGVCKDVKVLRGELAEVSDGTC